MDKGEKSCEARAQSYSKWRHGELTRVNASEPRAANNFAFGMEE